MSIYAYPKFVSQQSNYKKKKINNKYCMISTHSINIQYRFGRLIDLYILAICKIRGEIYCKKLYHGAGPIMYLLCTIIGILTIRYIFLLVLYLHLKSGYFFVVVLLF